MKIKVGLPVFLSQKPVKKEAKRKTKGKVTQSLLFLILIKNPFLSEPGQF